MLRKKEYNVPSPGCEFLGLVPSQLQLGKVFIGL